MNCEICGELIPEEELPPRKTRAVQKDGTIVVMSLVSLICKKCTATKDIHLKLEVLNEDNDQSQ